jgi:hypothetical protein
VVDLLHLHLLLDTIIIVVDLHLVMIVSEDAHLKEIGSTLAIMDPTLVVTDTLPWWT